MSAGALLAPALAGLDAPGPLPDDAAFHLDRGYDGAPTRRLLDGYGITAVTDRRGVPTPLQVSGRWVVERTHSWMNGFGKRRRCMERSGIVVDVHLLLAATFVTTPASSPQRASAFGGSIAQRPADAHDAHCRSLLTPAYPLLRLLPLRC